MPLSGEPFANESIGVLFLFFWGVALSGEAAAGLFNAGMRRGFLSSAGDPSEFSPSSSLAAILRVSMRLATAAMVSACASLAPGEALALAAGGGAGSGTAPLAPGAAAAAAAAAAADAAAGLAHHRTHL